MHIVSYEGPKYSKGNLVTLSPEIAEGISEDLGIVVSEPRLIFVYDWKTKAGFPNEFWSYDVKIGNELFKMIPEQFLRGLNEDAED